MAGVALAAAPCGRARAVAVGLLRQRRASADRAAAGAPGAPAYLVVIALETVAAYGLNGGIDPHAAVVDAVRPFLLLAPVALFGGMADGRGHAELAQAGVALVAVWAALPPATACGGCELHRRRPAASFGTVADDLVAHGVKYGRAQYWDAYA